MKSSYVIRGLLSTISALLLTTCVHRGAQTSTTGTAAKSAAASARTPERVHVTPKALPERQDIPAVLRQALRGEMDRHGATLNFLLADVILLRYEAAEQLATQLLEEPKLSRPAPFADQSLNTLLPDAFFDHQDALAASTGALAKAARARDDAALAKAFGAVAQTCVACHTSYLHDPLPRAPRRSERSTW